MKFLPILYRKKSLSTDLLACYSGSDYWAEVGGCILTFVCYSGSGYFLEFKILNFAKGELGKVQVRDLVRVVEIFAPFAPRGSVPGENSFYQAPGG